MRLKHLQLHGYKTFAAKTELLFPSGITAIIGPNGSGKSNVADAVRWVLGEQSYTTLRGKRTEDMIFSGSESRSRAGMAEVILTLDNTDDWLPLDYSEVTVSRRAFRDGQNEYRINNNRVRLRDITELLSQSGLSHRTYTIIGQGLVDSVLSLRAQERRVLFEEAAGIAHYRDKRADSLRRLDDTLRNLDRVRDIIAEIEPRLNRLARQAERANEHTELSVHLARLLRIWYGYRWGMVSTALVRAQTVARQFAEQYQKRVAKLDSVDSEMDVIRREQSVVRRQVADWQGERSRIHSGVETAQLELAVLGERRQQMKAQRHALNDEAIALDERIISQQGRVDRALAETEHAQKALNETEYDVKTAQAALNACLAERAAILQAVNANRERVTFVRTRIAQQQAFRDTLSARVKSIATQKLEHEKVVARSNEELNTYDDRISRIDEQLTRVEAKAREAENSSDHLERQRQKLAEELTRMQYEHQKLLDIEAESAARREVLGKLRREFAYYGKAAGHLIAAGLPGVLGVLAQMIDVHRSDGDDPYAAIEAALGAFAGAVVVTDWQSAVNALDFIKSDGDMGRVIFVSLKQPHGRADPVSAEQKLRDHALLSTLVSCTRELRPLVDRLLARSYLVRDVDVARTAFAHIPADACVVTLAGDILRSDGTIQVGPLTAPESPMRQEREWVELNEKRTELGAKREALELEIGEIRTLLDDVQIRQADAHTVLRGLRDEKTRNSTHREELSRGAERIRHEADWRGAQIASAAAELAGLLPRLSQINQELEVLEKELSSREEELEQLNSSADTLPFSELSESATAAQIAGATARQKHQARTAVQKELTNYLYELTQEKKQRLRRINELNAAEQVVGEREQQVTQKQQVLTTQMDALMAKIPPAEGRLAELDEELAKLVETERGERIRLTEFESHITAARVEVQRREDALDQLRNRIMEELGLVELELEPGFSAQTPLPLHPLVSKLPVVKRLPDGAEEEVTRLRNQLRRLGAINPSAPEEYREILDRYNFLTEQSSDLLQASESLRRVIAEMDSLIDHAFRQTYEAVASEFSNVFSSLFGGGRARLELIDDIDLTKMGVEIVAQPPGKRLQPLASLSGGERALTAVALIFAILRVSPTPFCILDEVDAMLDEANIGRFRAVLETLTDDTQVVIITHNRGTICAADTVYGISMGADSVSQLFSIQLDGEYIREA